VLAPNSGAHTVFGPATDDGSRLVGLAARRQAHPFAGVRWPTEHAMANMPLIFPNCRAVLLRALVDLNIHLPDLAPEIFGHGCNHDARSSEEQIAESLAGRITSKPEFTMRNTCSLLLIAASFPVFASAGTAVALPKCFPHDRLIQKINTVYKRQFHADCAAPCTTGRTVRCPRCA
jgi:hypothetical protein